LQGNGKNAGADTGGKMKTIILAGLLLTFIAPPSFCQKNELSVKVTIKDRIIKAAKGFAVQGSVTNISKKDQSIVIVGCDYSDLWTVDNQSIEFPLIGCFKNILECKALKPGETIEWPLQQLLFRKLDHVKTGSLTFKLGFNASYCQGDVSHRNLNILKKQTYWSDPITVRFNK
jgi:hypothetical protein